MANFEEKLERLEEIGDLLKEGTIPLEESITLFEEGIKIAKGLEKELSKIERKVEILVNKPEPGGEAPQMELFEDE
ncbi:MAG TPA: exodeoxyribonuclease VII small subunit [Spirochaetia bacterium]|nr:exodeoxyribonuclease VII small subunit [Spirochaetia bacterium]